MLRHWLIIILPLAFTIGCSTDGPPPGQPFDETAKIADLTYTGGGVSAEVYFHDNPYAVNRAREFAADEGVAATIDHLRSQGYRLRRDGSCVIEGWFEGRLIRLVFLSMDGRSDEHPERVVVGCREERDQIDVFPACFLQIEPTGEHGFEPITNGVWMASAAPEPYLGSAPGASIEDLRNVYGCVYSNGADMAKCAFAAYGADPNLMQCAVVCGGYDVVGRIVRCWGQPRGIAFRDKKP